MPERAVSEAGLGPAPRIAYLDAWRFFAVACVIVGHVMGHMVARGVMTTDGGTLQLGRVATLGVDLFFFISGYVICRGLLHEQETTGTVSLRAFYLRRAFRILPPLALYLATLTLLGPGLHWIDPAAAEVMRSALFVCNIHWLGGTCSWLTTHTWSLGFEEQFYIVFPVLFVLLGLGRRPVTKNWRPWLALVAVAGAGLLVRAFVRGFPVYYASNAAFLATGCCAARLEPRISELAAKVHARVWLVLLAAVLAAFTLLPLSEYKVLILFLPLPILLLVLTTPLQQRTVRRIFESPVIGYLGRISYSVYLWQQLAFWKWQAAPAPVIPLLVLPVFYWAHWSWRHIEAPLIRIGREWSERLKAADAIARSPG